MAFEHNLSGHRHEAEVTALLTELGNRNIASSVGLVAYGGSTAYGLDTEASDVDLRGFFLPTKENILMMSDVEDAEIKEGVDGMLYSVKKLTKLLLSSNPNVIEILGLAPEHVLVSSPFYKQIVVHKDIYISRKAAETFGGYAVQQLRRIENSMSRDKGDTDTEGALRSMRAAIGHFDEKYTGYAEGDISVELDDDEVGSKSLFVSMDLKRFPVHQLRGICGDLDAIAKNADNLAARNRKKKTEKLSKHMSHLIRLLRMGCELLETGEVNTRRVGDAEFLLALKQGIWMEEDADGTRHIDDAFWDVLEEEKSRFEYAKTATTLPKSPDFDAAYELMREMHAAVLAK